MLNKGFIHILLAGLVVIFLVVGIIVAIVVGLDGLQEEDFGRSLFSQDSEIGPAVQELREKKDALKERVSDLRERQAADQGKVNAQPEQETSDDDDRF